MSERSEKYGQPKSRSELDAEHEVRQCGDALHVFDMRMKERRKRTPPFPYEDGLSAAEWQLRAHRAEAEVGRLERVIKELHEKGASEKRRWAHTLRRSFAENPLHVAKEDMATRMLEPIDPWPEHAGAYFARCAAYVKIGVAQNIRARVEGFHTYAPYPVELVAVEPGDQKHETALHRRFREYRVRGEWFRLAGKVSAYVASLRSAQEAR